MTELNGATTRRDSIDSQPLSTGGSRPSTSRRVSFFDWWHGAEVPAALHQLEQRVEQQADRIEALEFQNELLLQSLEQARYLHEVQVALAVQHHRSLNIRPPEGKR